uniref:Uncharacterized protein n=1 Tax=Anguilla anguilla TaxID=7936 RepID=A0A0E9SB28_ANGAN
MLGDRLVKIKVNPKWDACPGLV